MFLVCFMVNISNKPYSYAIFVRQCLLCKYGLSFLSNLFITNNNTSVEKTDKLIQDWFREALERDWRSLCSPLRGEYA